MYGRDAAISTPAKTVIDCIDRPELAGGPAEITRIVYGASGEVDAKELVETALQMKSTALLQRLGFLADLVGWSLPEDVRNALRAAIPKTTRSTRPRRRKEGDVGYVAKWELFVHAREQELLADVPRRRPAKGAQC